MYSHETNKKNTCLVMNGNKARRRLAGAPRLSICRNGRFKQKKANCHKWLIKSRQPSNLYQRPLSRNAADVTAELSSSEKDAVCLQITNFDGGAVSGCDYFKREASQRFLFYSMTFSVVSRRGGARQLYTGPPPPHPPPSPSPCYWHLWRDGRWNKAD